MKKDNPLHQEVQTRLSEDEILALEGRELDAHVEHIRQPTYTLFKHPGGISLRKGESLATIGFYHRSLDAVRPVVEKCVQECGDRLYLFALAVVTMPDIYSLEPEALALEQRDFMMDGWLLPLGSVSRMIDATASDQGKAVLLAYLRKERA